MQTDGWNHIYFSRLSQAYQVKGLLQESIHLSQGIARKVILLRVKYMGSKTQRVFCLLGFFKKSYKETVQPQRHEVSLSLFLLSVKHR